MGRVARTATAGSAPVGSIEIIAVIQAGNVEVEGQPREKVLCFGGGGLKADLRFEVFVRVRRAAREDEYDFAE